MEYLTIGKLAKKAGVNVDTIRYYEKQGLIPKPQRTESGYRQYTRDSVKRMLFIKRAKGLGFTLKEISELLSLRFDQDARCRDIKDLAKSKMSDIKEKIELLQQIKTALIKLIKACNENQHTDACPILQALSIDEEEISSSEYRRIK